MTVSETHKILPSVLMTSIEPRGGKHLHNYLNLWAIEDALIGVDLQFTYCYELTPPDLLYRTEGEHIHFFQMIRGALHSLPENTTVQLVVQARRGDGGLVAGYEATVKSEIEVARFIVDQKAAFLRSQLVVRRRYFVFYTTHPENSDISKMSVTGFKYTTQNMKEVTANLHHKRLAQLASHSREFETQLQAIGVGVRRLSEGEVLEYLYRYLNPSRSSFLTPRDYKHDETLRTQVALNACENEFTQVNLDGFYHRAVNLATRPEDVEFHQGMTFLSKLRGDYDFCVTIHSINQDIAEKRVRRMATISRLIAGTRTIVKYIEAEQKASAAEVLISDVKNSFQKIFQASIAVILHNENLADLTSDTNTAVEAFRQIGESEGIIDDMNHLPLFLACLPGHSHLNIRRHYMSTDAVAQLLPLSAPWKGCGEPKILFQTDDRQLLPFDLFAPGLPAKHFLILGSTGAGKSFTTNMLLTNFYIESDNNHIVIIDVGGSYRKLCGLFGGQYLSPNLSDPEKYAFNPFPKRDLAVRDSRDESFEVDSEIQTYLVALVQKMLRVTELSGQQKLVIQRAVTETYRKAPTDPPLLEHLEEQLLSFDGDDEDRKSARDFGKNLKLWTTGSYGKILNRPSTLNVNARFVVFDLQQLGDEQGDLKSIIVFIIKNSIYSKLADKSLRKMIIFDEAWRFFNDPAGVVLINDLYKTARKFNAAIGTISQSAADMSKSAAKEAIIENSYIKYILRLGGGYELLPDFRFTDEDIKAIKSLVSEKGVYSDIFVRFDKYRRVIRIQPSPTDYWVCTTDADDETQEKKIRDEHPGYTEVQLLQTLAKLRK